MARKEKKTIFYVERLLAVEKCFESVRLLVRVKLEVEKEQVFTAAKA